MDVEKEILKLREIIKRISDVLVSNSGQIVSISMKIDEIYPLIIKNENTTTQH